MRFIVCFCWLTLTVTGVSPAEAAEAVERLARKHGIAEARRPAWRTSVIIVAALTVSVLLLLSVVSS